ncbi:MAG TPA: hypothetical protein VKB29_05465 [Candidatus Binataceae bacterium]|nr:hypothetical protein [Candidatus Binataceae bacterium]
MADQVEKAERAVSALIRFGISAILPVWALLMIVLGAEYRSPWWLGTGLVVGAIGVLFLAGSPIAKLIYPSR